ncbi:hypothetical protein HD806DRAFT_548315 [Xylariaceae sp. AK1471]|nr:hypothetical protein HD806DRAFT_548315 [Xylariaceae sp. AK1471]
METSNSPPTTSDSQTRKRKGRNSDLRKEQNRIASRAYREKRKQKLALLNEILKSDSHTDSMSSVSDETEFNPTTPALEFRAMEEPHRSRHSSDSPAPFYLPPVPALAPMAAGIQPLSSNGPSCDTETYVSYPMSGYSQENDEIATHAEYARDSIVGMSSDYGSPHSSVTPMPSTPLFPYNEEFVGDAFSAYPLPDGSMPSFSATSGYDPNMINALQSISRLNDSQQQEIVAYLQKKRSLVQPPMADHTYGLVTYRMATMLCTRAEDYVDDTPLNRIDDNFDDLL